MTSLSGKNVLLVEDEWLLACELEQAIMAAGATVAGPYADIKSASADISGVDLAVLNVNVRDGTTYPLAAMLRERGVPIVFATGQDMMAEPTQWHSQLWITKPYAPAEIIALLESALPPS